MSLSDRKKSLGRLMCVLSLPLAWCGYAERTELETIQSVQGAVVNKSGYNYVLYRDIEYLGEGLREEKADLYLPASFASDANQTFPAVVEIHGGGWAGGEKDWYLATSLAKELTKAGYAVLSIDYKLMKQADDLKGIKKQIAWPQNLYDCKSAVRFLRKYSKQLHVQPDRIVVMGESAGGHLALLTGYTADDEVLNWGGLYREQSSSVAAVVNLYGITDVYRWRPEAFYDDNTLNPAEEIYRASPLSHVSSKTPPTLTIHGDADKVVPFAQGKRLHELLDKYAVDNKFLGIKGIGHAFPVVPHETNNQTDFVPVLLEFLGKNLCGRFEENEKKGK